MIDYVGDLIQDVKDGKPRDVLEPQSDELKYTVKWCYSPKEANLSTNLDDHATRLSEVKLVATAGRDCDRSNHIQPFSNAMDKLIADRGVNSATSSQIYDDVMKISNELESLFECDSKDAQICYIDLVRYMNYFLQDVEDGKPRDVLEPQSDELKYTVKWCYSSPNLRYKSSSQ